MSEWDFRDLEAAAPGLVKLNVLRPGLRQAISYHRRYHRPELFAARPGSIQDCGLPSCRAFLAAFAADRERELIVMTGAQQDWYFTFGLEHPLARRYIKLHGTREDTRTMMTAVFGLGNWSRQYDPHEAIRVIGTYSLRELDLSLPPEAASEPGAAAAEAPSPGPAAAQ